VRKVAHFLLIPELATSPPNEAMISAYLELGFDVDVYSPGAADVSFYGHNVASSRTEYSYRWLAKNMFSLKWREYAALSATTEDPMAVAGALSLFWRKPLIVLADEIKSGSYAGNRTQRWKAICRAGMRRAALTVVNEHSRIALQRSYAGLPETAKCAVYPGAFRAPPFPKNRAQARASRGIAEESLLLCYSGTYNIGNGGLWLLDALKRISSLRVWAQCVGIDALTRGMLERSIGAERMYLEPRRLGWQESWSVSAAADIGMVVYLQDAPQFQNMGIASNRLCMFLSMGVPVIASRQPSFEFIEQYDCGILVDSSEEFCAAVGTIAARLDEMKANALRCAREYIAANQRYVELRAAVASALRLPLAPSPISVQ
jgi:hypothetical protein